MKEFYAKLSKTQRVVFDVNFWISFLVLMLFLCHQFGIVILTESGMLEFHFDTIEKVLWVVIPAVVVSCIKITLYKGEKTMAYNYQNKNRPPVDPYLADDDDVDVETFQNTEREEKPARRKRKSHSANAANASNVLQKVEGITVRRYLHQNIYDGADDAKRKFMKDSCNTYEIQISDQIQVDGRTFDVPEVFRSFYLHFEFRSVKNENVKLEDDVTRDLDFYLLNCENNEIVMQVKFSYQLYLYACSKQDLATAAFKMTLGYDEHGNINALRLGYEEEQISIKNVFHFVAQAITKMSGKNAANNHGMANVNNDMGTDPDFKYTTRKNHLNVSSTAPVIFYNANGKPMQYTMSIQSFKNFCSINCPVCGKIVNVLGVPGIVLYGDSDWDALETSNKLTEYLIDLKNVSNENRNDSEKKLIDIVDEVIRVNYAAVRREQIQEIDYAKQKCSIRIPLGKTQLDTGRPVTTPYNYTEKNEEYEFLRSLNEKMCADLDGAPTDKLYLLKPSKNFHVNHYVHDTLIKQLCSNCYSKLPDNFYMYDSVITIYFYGNSNAGKTTLLLSEKNQIEGAVFNNLFVSCDENDISSRDRTRETIDYQQKAEELAVGIFPVGTKDTEIIPGLLSPLKLTNNGITKNHLFNYYDMSGSRANDVWDSASNFVYVHALKDDPSTLMGDSLYRTLYRLINNPDSMRQYNIQFFLSMIDEYPKFLYDRIVEHNQKYEAKMASINREEILAYSIDLLKILEECLYEDFSGRRASDIISEPIQEELLLIDRLGALDFGKPYREVHKEIWTVCRPIADSIHDPRVDLCRSILRYLHGLDVIRDNYSKFRDLVKRLLSDMMVNASNNQNSRFWFSVYAVSATSFTSIEATGKASRKESVQYAPQFVKEANRMLQISTFDYIKDIKNQERGIDSKKFDREYLLNEDGFCRTVSQLFENTMATSEIFGKDINALQNMSGDVAELAAWYLITQQNGSTVNAHLQSAFAPQGSGNPNSPINPDELSVRADNSRTDSGELTELKSDTVSEIKKRKMRD